MKKVLVSFAMAAMMVACGQNANKAQEEAAAPAEAPKAECCDQCKEAEASVEDAAKAAAEDVAKTGIEAAAAAAKDAIAK